MSSDPWVAKTILQIDQKLDSVLPPETTHPAQLHQSMRYSVLAKGKRLRGMLLVAAGELGSNGTKDILITAAAAVELFHTYTLIHDDLPSMDNDNLRRGKPANHKVYGDAAAILSGDALQSLAYQLLADLVPQAGNKAAAAVSELAAAGGSLGVVGGQAADIISQNAAGSIVDLDYIHMHKTGKLITAAARIGGMLGDVHKRVLVELTGFARKIGLAFQIVDDLLDVTGTESQLGKTAGSDLRHVKLTYPALVGISESQRMVKQLQAEAESHLNVISGDTSKLRLLLDLAINRKK